MDIDQRDRQAWRIQLAQVSHMYTSKPSWIIGGAATRTPGSLFPLDSKHSTDGKKESMGEPGNVIFAPPGPVSYNTLLVSRRGGLSPDRMKLAFIPLFCVSSSQVYADSTGEECILTNRHGGAPGTIRVRLGPTRS